MTTTAADTLARIKISRHAVQGRRSRSLPQVSNGLPQKIFRTSEKSLGRTVGGATDALRRCCKLSPTNVALQACRDCGVCDWLKLADDTRAGNQCMMCISGPRGATERGPEGRAGREGREGDYSAADNDEGGGSAVGTSKKRFHMLVYSVIFGGGPGHVKRQRAYRTVRMQEEYM